MSPEIQKKTRELAQPCPLCGAVLTPWPSSSAVQKAASGDITDEEAKRFLLVAHLRHEHTPYDAILAEVRERELAKGASEDEAFTVAHLEARGRTAGRMAWLIQSCDLPPGQRNPATCCRVGVWTLGATARVVKSSAKATPAPDEVREGA